MPDLRLISPPPRDELVEKLRGRLGHAVPGSRVIAEGLLGDDARVDFVAIEPGGRVAVLLVGDHDEDLELVGRGLAQRAWVAARLADWLQLAPHLELRADSTVRVVLLCPDFAPETRAAIRALGPEMMVGVVYRCVHNGASFEVLLEHLSLPETAAETPCVEAPAPVGKPVFRTGLSDADLGLTPEELREFE
jgi:hypothetical protein